MHIFLIWHEVMLTSNELNLSFITLFRIESIVVSIGLHFVVLFYLQILHLCK